MRLRELSLRGLTRFNGTPLRIDFDALGPGLVAIVGPNGAGKTTVIEAVAAALYKGFPSRPGSLYDYTHGRDSFVEATFDDAGHELKVRVQVDSDRRTTESYLFLDGRPLTTGRAAEFDLEVSRRFGSQELFLASILAAQNKAGNFLVMRKSDRKALFIELLALGKLELLHAEAKDRRDRVDQELLMSRSLAEKLAKELDALPALEQDCARVEVATALAAGAVDLARKAEGAAISQLERARTAGERLSALERAAERARAGLMYATRALEQARDLPEKARSRAEERLRFIASRKAEGLEPIARRRHAEALKSVESRRGAAEKTIAEAPDFAALDLMLAHLRDERAALEIARNDARELRTQEAGATGALDRALGNLLAAQRSREREIEMFSRHSNLLEKVPCTGSPRWQTWPVHSTDQDLAGECPLLADARTAKERLASLQLDADPHRDLRLTVDGARANLEEVQKSIRIDDERLAPLRADRLAEINRTEASAQTGLARRPLVEKAHIDLADLDLERQLLDEKIEMELAGAREAVATAAADSIETRQQLERDLQVAEASLAEATASFHEAGDSASRASEDLRTARNGFAGTDVHAAEEEARQARATREKAEIEVRGSDQQKASLDARIEALRAKQVELEQIQEGIRTTERELGDWRLLEDALGRDGIQALEIDAAGPEVARLTNDLLEACYGPRFSISFETLREKKSARGEYSEAFDVRVYDGGAERQVEALSGGEKVVVGEAIGLALSIFNSRKSGIRWETLFRDETAGALDPENAQRYVSMLRRALSLGGYRQVIYVAHLPAVWEAADVQLHVEDGRIRIGGQDEVAA